MRSTSTITEPSFADCHFLVVDDENEITKSISRHLKRYGAATETASNGKKAIEILQKDASSFALVITDIIMPTMDGLTLARWIHIHCPMLPILFMSAFGSQEIVQGVIRQGQDMYVAKPFMPAELCASIRTILMAEQQR